MSGIVQKNNIDGLKIHQTILKMEKCLYRDPGTHGKKWSCQLEKGHEGNHIPFDPVKDNGNDLSDFKSRTFVRRSKY